MKRPAIAAIALLLALGAAAERVRWIAAEAFAQAGVIESYLPADGKEWLLANGDIALSFWKNGGSNPPQMLLHADNGAEQTPGMFLSEGNTLELLAAEGMEITRVRLSTTSFYPTPALDATPLPAEEHVITLPANGRMVVTMVDITYSEANAIKETEAETPSGLGSMFDLQGRRLAAPPRRGFYIAGGRLAVN